MNDTINYAQEIVTHLQEQGYTPDSIIGYLQGTLDGLRHLENEQVTAYLENTWKASQKNLIRHQYENLSPMDRTMVERITLDHIRNKEVSSTFLVDVETEDYIKEACRLAERWGGFTPLIKAYYAGDLS
jgi:hypothetical protein